MSEWYTCTRFDCCNTDHISCQCTAENQAFTSLGFELTLLSTHLLN